MLGLIGLLFGEISYDFRNQNVDFSDESLFEEGQLFVKFKENVQVKTDVRNGDFTSNNEINKVLKKMN